MYRFSRTVLSAAVARVLANRGCPGLDGLSVNVLAAAPDSFFDSLASSLSDTGYRPLPLRAAQVEVLRDGRPKFRRLAIPAIRDRVLATASLLELQPRAESLFDPASHGYRPRRGVPTALAALWQSWRDGYRFILDADISAFFDTIPHGPLLDALAAWLGPRSPLSFAARRWLTRPVWDGRHLQPAQRGLPQGCPFSPLLANLYLHPFDRLIRSRGWRLVRYADDFLVLTRRRNHLDQALLDVQSWLAAAGLSLHPAKTRLRLPGSTFVFLGREIRDGVAGPQIDRPSDSRLVSLAPVWTAADYLRFGYGPSSSTFSSASPKGFAAWLRRRLPLRFSI